MLAHGSAKQAASLLDACSRSADSRSPNHPALASSNQNLILHIALAEDYTSNEFVRLPMDHRTDAEKAAATSTANKVSAGDADAAMNVGDDEDEDDDAVMINPSDLSVPEPVVRTKLADIQGADALSFPAVSHVSTSGLTQRRKVGIPQHRMTPLKRDWIKVSTRCAAWACLSTQWLTERRCRRSAVPGPRVRSTG